MVKDKNRVMSDFDDMIKNSWTYDKMTKEEKDKWVDVFTSVRTCDAINGTYEQRWKILQAIYGAYLNGIGYDNFSWRE